MSMPRSLYVLLAFLVPVASQAVADPFGISLKKAPASIPTTWTLLDTTTGHFMYETTKVPKPHPFFQTYQIFLTQSKKTPGINSPYQGPPRPMPVSTHRGV